jgi:hypothetical protein
MEKFPMDESTPQGMPLRLLNGLLETQKRNQERNLRQIEALTGHARNRE